MAMRGSAEDKNHNPILHFTWITSPYFFIKGCFLCHVLVYKWCLDYKFCLYRLKPFGEHSSLPAIFFLFWSRPFHQHVASWPWPSDDLDIQHCSLKFCFSITTFSLVNRFTSYSHTLFLWSRPLHWYATWLSNDLAIEPLKPLFTYKDLAMYFFSWSQGYLEKNIKIRF